MELNEAFRRIVGGHWKLLVVVLVAALGTLTVLVMNVAPTYVASGRLQASTTLLGSDVEADSMLNRVVGVATSPAVVAKAIDASGVADRSAVEVATHHVTVTRLGSSAVFDLSVTDPDRQAAAALTSALVDGVVTFLNNGSAQTQKLIDQLSQQVTSLRATRAQTAASVTLAKNSVDAANAAAQLAGQDQELTDLATTVRQLEIALATNGQAAVVSPGGAPTEVPRNLTTTIGIAAGLALVVALALASLLEILRPKAPDLRAAARELAAPAIDPGPDQHLALQLQRATSRAGVGTLVVVRDDDGEVGGIVARVTDLVAPFGATSFAVPNGVPLNHQRHSQSDGTRRRATILLEHVPAVAIPARPRAVRVAGLHTPLPVDATCGLLVVVDKPVRYAFLHKIADLSASTGWPVVAVMSRHEAVGEQPAPEPAGRAAPEHDGVAGADGGHLLDGGRLLDGDAHTGGQR